MRITSLRFTMRFCRFHSFAVVEAADISVACVLVSEGGGESDPRRALGGGVGVERVGVCDAERRSKAGIVVDAVVLRAMNPLLTIASEDVSGLEDRPVGPCTTGLGKDLVVLLAALLAALAAASHAKEASILALPIPVRRASFSW